MLNLIRNAFTNLASAVFLLSLILQPIFAMSPQPIKPHMKVLKAKHQSGIETNLSAEQLDHGIRKAYKTFGFFSSVALGLFVLPAAIANIAAHPDTVVTAGILGGIFFTAGKLMMPKTNMKKETE